MRAAVFVIALAACSFPPEPKMPEPVPLVAAPTSLTARPVKAGQWAIYRERVRGWEVGDVAFAATREAACGTWFVAELRGLQHTTEWQFCVARSGTIVEAMLDGARVDPAEHAAQLEPLRTRVVPPRFAGRFVIDEAHVPAGHFFGALRIDGATTTWLHPTVPLGAVVKVRDGDREDVLVAYGETMDSARASSQSQACSSPRPSSSAAQFYEAGLSIGSMSPLPAHVPTGVEGLRFTVGRQIAARLDAIAAFDFGTNRAGSPATTISTTFWGAGLRWRPWRHERQYPGFLDPGGKFLQLAVGYAGVGDSSGLGVTATAGVELAHGTDWGVLVEADAEGVLVYGSSSHYGFDAILAIRLDVP